MTSARRPPTTSALSGPVTVIQGVLASSMSLCVVETLTAEEIQLTGAPLSVRSIQTDCKN